MKTMRKFALLMLALIAVGLLGSCDLLQSRMRKLPPAIQIFNSRLERTLKMVPNDTLYVKVNGLASETNYTVQALDASDGIISELMTVTDSSGTIGISPLWYDVGFRKDANGEPYLESGADLALHAFNIKVFSTDDNGVATNFKLPFFFVNTTVLARPEPIVMAGKKDPTTGKFVLDNAFQADNTNPSQSGDVLYVKAANMTDLGSTTATQARVYIVPFSGVEWETGQEIDPNGHWFYQDCTLDDLISGTGVKIKWPPSSPTDTTTPRVDNIPNYAKSRAYTVVLDVGSDGKYNVLKEGTSTYYLDGIDGNGVAGFIVKEPPVPPVAAYIPINLASTGIFGYEYTNNGWSYTYGYANTFNKYGYGTNYASHTAAEFYGYGLKVIWNPYGSYNGVGGAIPNTGLYWGATVDVFIVKSDQALTNGATIVSAPGTYKRRVPVQYGCSNGYYQQTIWKPTMIPGDYMIIVDMDKSGTVTARDLIDERDTNGTQRLVGGKPAGFSVY